MKKIYFSYENTGGLSSADFQLGMRFLVPEIERLQEVTLAGGYTTDYASVNLPADTQMLEKVQLVVDAKKALRPTALVVVGIGGSHLGTLAVQQALLGTQYNAQQPDLKIYYVDSVDADYTYDVYLLVEQELQQGHQIILNVISKSGATTETIANFMLFEYLLKQYYPQTYREAIVLTTNYGSPLWELAQQEEFDCLDIPQRVGGRYSVFSPVGLFPLGLLNIDLEMLLAGAAQVVAPCTSIEVTHNKAALSALLLKEHYFSGKNIHDTFLCSVDFAGFGLWYRQLMAESVGKMYDRDGGLVRTGMLPTVSQATADLHSVAQLYLGGPLNRFTTFVTVDTNKANLVVPRDIERKVLTKLERQLQGKTYHELMQAIVEGVRIAYLKQEMPFVTFSIPEKTAYYLGQLIQIKMFEIIYLGFLLDINPFDQPEVELYKQETRKILSHE